MKIILVVPPGGYSAVRWEKGSMPFLGIAYLGAVLEKAGFKVEILDAFIEGWTFEKTVQVLAEKNPDVVGFTFATENRFEGFKLIKMVKEALPKTVLVAGGPHVSMAADDTLKHLPELDYLVRGEGEMTFLEMAQKFRAGERLDGITGLSLVREGEVIHNPGRKFIENLDSLPMPAWHQFNWKKYNLFLEVPGLGKLPAANLMSSRGCPFGCNFCSSSQMWGQQVRMHSAERVLEEFERLEIDLGARAIWIFDDTFTINRKRVETICENLIRRNSGLRWVAEIRVDTVDFELLKLMKDAGCYLVGFGVESGSQRIIDEVIGKKIKVDEAVKVGQWCQKLGITSNPFLILSHPGETQEDALKTMEFLRNWPKGNPVSLAILHIYPGTKLETIAREKKILPVDFSWSVPDERVFTLPSVQGNVPIFLDKLSWPFLSRLMIEWAGSQKFPIWKKIPKVIRQIRNWRDFKRYFTLGGEFLNYKLRNLFK